MFSTLSLFNRLSRHAFKSLHVLKGILEVYEELHIDYLDSGEAFMSEEAKLIIDELEEKTLKYKPCWLFRI